MRRLLVFVLVSLLLLPCGMARRTSGDIKRERQATERKINNTRRQINSNIDDTRRELNRLTSLEGDIRLNDADIARLSVVNDSLKRNTAILADSVEKATAKVERLRRSRAASLRAARRQRQTSGSKSAFIFSSESFRQAMRRASYLRDLARWQDSSATALARSAEVLDRRRAAFDSARAVLQANIEELAGRRVLLEQNTREVKTVVASLKRQGRNLEKVLDEQRLRAEKLDRELNRVIEEEARLAAEEVRKKEEERKKKEREEAEKRKNRSGDSAKTPAPEPAPAPVTPAAADIPFDSLKGRLPMPLDRAAKVAVPFGVQTHAEYTKVRTKNNGIDFETSAGASARAVHAGTVSMVIVMDGYHNVVLLRHGEYLTVYAGLDDLAVRKGQQVAAGERLGTVWSDSSDGDRTRLHFEVRHEKEKLNPSQWLRIP